MKKLFIAISLISGLFSQTDAYYTLRNWSVVDSASIPYMPLNKHFERGMQALENRDWQEAINHFYVITETFPKTPLGLESFYYLGIAYFRIEEYEYANNAFTQYLKNNSHPEFFIESVTYKFSIANKFKEGVKTRLVNWKYMPKWSSADDIALQIYDEVTTAMPAHEMAAQVLFAKAEYLVYQRRFREAIDTYQQVIRRFPKHELTPRSYVEIAKVHLTQSEAEENNPDLLALAEINLRKFKMHFPKDQAHIGEIESLVCQMKEIYAKSMYDTGRFYERKGHPSASVIYYTNTVKRFPETVVARKCQGRLIALTGKPAEFSKETEKPIEAPQMQDALPLELRDDASV